MAEPTTENKLGPEDPTSELVLIRHPDVAATSMVPVHAFLSVWKARGWERMSVGEAAATSLLGKVVYSLDSLTKDELTTVANSLGVDPTGSDTKSDIAAQIEARSGLLSADVSVDASTAPADAEPVADSEPSLVTEESDGTEDPSDAAVVEVEVTDADPTPRTSRSSRN